MRKPIQWRTDRLIKATIISLVPLVMGMKGIIETRVLRQHMIPLKGTYSSAVINIYPAEKATNEYASLLVFELREYDKVFMLRQYLGMHTQNDYYTGLKAKLRTADSITIWIADTDSSTTPRVLQVKADDVMILPADSDDVLQTAQTMTMTGGVLFAICGTMLYFHFKAKHRLKQRIAAAI